MARYGNRHKKWLRWASITGLVGNTAGTAWWPCRFEPNVYPHEVNRLTSLQCALNISQIYQCLCFHWGANRTGSFVAISSSGSCPNSLGHLLPPPLPLPFAVTDCGLQSGERQGVAHSLDSARWSPRHHSHLCLRLCVHGSVHPFSCRFHVYQICLPFPSSRKTAVGPYSRTHSGPPPLQVDVTSLFFLW